MKLNKFLTIAAGLALIFASCQKDVEREPSPAFPESVAALYFPSPDERGAEVDPSAGIFKSTVTIARRDSVGELTVALKVVENTDSVFVVPENVTFADNEKSVDFEISFDKAQAGVTYNLIIEADQSNVNPYTEGSIFYQFSVTPIKWIAAEKPAIFDGWVFAAFYGVPETHWYVPFEYAELGGGALRYRFKNVYASAASDMDEWGIADGFPFNDPGDWDDSRDWNTIINVDKDGVAIMSSHQIGVNWGYGAIEIGMTRDFTGSEDYNYGECSDKGVITFAAGDIFMTMPDVGTRATKNDHVIYLDPDVLIDEIKEANSSVKLSNFENGFNDEGIEWEEVEGLYKRFETSALNEKGAAWEQNLVNAVDPNAENPEIGSASDFYNLYMLPDLYADGFGFAFYYDTISGSIRVPNAKQPTGVKFGGKALSLMPNDKESFVEVVNIKGTDVKLFHFNLDLVTSDDITFGSYEELFYFSKDPIMFVAEDFEGSYLASGKPMLNGQAALENLPVTIEAAEAENTLLIKGFDLADPIVATFEPATGVVSIAPQLLSDYIDEWDELDEETGDSVHLSATYAMMLMIYTTSAGPSSEIPMLFSQLEDKSLAITESSDGFGYLVYGQNVEDATDAGYFDGYHSISFSPATEAPAAAPKHVARHSHNNKLMSVKVATGKAISTSHLRAQGKVSRHSLVAGSQIR